MSKSSILVLLAAVAIAISGLAYGQVQQQAAQQQAAVKWEYKVVRMPDFELSNATSASDRLNDAAVDGWELQQFYTVTGSRVTAQLAIFKRPVANAAAR